MGSTFLKEQFLKVIREDKDKELIELFNNNTQSNLTIYTPDKYINENKDFTALNIAASFGSAKVADILLKKGWNIEIAEKTDGNNSLLLCCKFGHLTLVKLFIDNKANISYLNKHKLNCLDMAVLSGHYSVANYLYNKGIEIKTLEDYKLLFKVPSFDMSLFYSSLISGVLPENVPSFALKKTDKSKNKPQTQNELKQSKTHNERIKRDSGTEFIGEDDSIPLSSRFSSSKFAINKSDINCQDVSISIQTIKIQHKG